MSNATYDVAIVGAGPTGLTLANILGRAGCKVALIERNESTVQQPRAVSIDDESLRTMQSIKLETQVIRDVSLDYGSHYYTKSGTCFLKVEPTTREYGFPRRNAFSQPTLENTLREGLQRFENVETFFLHSCEQISQNETGVTLDLRRGDGENVELNAAYAVGCDGAHSLLRKTIGATLSGSTYDQRWLIVDLATTSEQLRQTRVICNPERPLITLPGPQGIRRYEFMLRDDESDDDSVDETFVRELLAKYGPDKDAPILRKQVYAFHARMVDKWMDRRIMLAGDAAHLTPPFAGQGMNSGIRDAHNLGWKLVAVLKGSLGPQLLDTYPTERAPHAWSLIQLAVSMGRIMMPASKINAWLVQTGFRLARIAPQAQAYFAEMKYKPKPFYKDGLVARNTNALDIVGRMMPQPEVESPDGKRMMLDDITGSDVALIAYGMDAENTIRQARSLDLGIKPELSLAVLPPTYNQRFSLDNDVLVLRDLGGILAQRGEKQPTRLIIARPDHYVMAATENNNAGLDRFAKDCRELIGKTWDGQPASHSTT